MRKTLRRILRTECSLSSCSRPLRCATAVLYLGSAQTLKANPKESHLRNIRQLTHGGTNAEAYFSADGKKLIFQSTRDPYKCDQIFSMNSDGSNLQLVSTGKGRTTCAYFTPDGKRDHLRIDAPGLSRLPAGRRSVGGICLGALQGLRYFLGKARWHRYEAPHQHRGLRRGGQRYLRTERRSFSRPRATATSNSMK